MPQVTHKGSRTHRSGIWPYLTMGLLTLGLITTLGLLAHVVPQYGQHLEAQLLETHQTGSNAAVAFNKYFPSDATKTSQTLVLLDGAATIQLAAGVTDEPKSDTLHSLHTKDGEIHLRIATDSADLAQTLRELTKAQAVRPYVQRESGLRAQGPTTTALGFERGKTTLIFLVEHPSVTTLEAFETLARSFTWQ